MAKKNYAPAEYKQDFMNLAATNPADAADVAMKWRERFHNAVDQARTTNEQLMEFGFAGLTSALMGGFQGWQTQKRDALEAAWVASNDEVIKFADEEDVSVEKFLEDNPTPWSYTDGGIREPGKWFLPVSIAVAAALGGLAAFQMAGDDFQRVLRASALGAVVFVGGQLGAMAGNRLRAQIRGAEESEEVEEAEEDQ